MPPTEYNIEDPEYIMGFEEFKLCDIQGLHISGCNTVN